MEDIEDLINSTKKYYRAKIQKRFFSRKNTVAYAVLDGKQIVIKWFASSRSKNIENEYQILQKGSLQLNIPIPLEFDKKNNVLCMSYIDSRNLCDIMNANTTKIKEKHHLARRLAEWFAKFHSYFSNGDLYYIRGDSQLRNFLLSDKIWGVDFEESRIGNPVEDIACTCASLFTTDPMFTNEKISICHTFINSYRDKSGKDLKSVHTEIAHALFEQIKRRPTQQKILRDFALQIKKYGLPISE
jgi:tRNA A-37 threonylcarbamoyl transferase component Bud32